MKTLAEPAYNVSREAKPAGERGPARPLRGGDRLRFAATFARQMQVLVGTGIPVSQALHATERQMRQPAWKAAIAPLREAVDEGAPMSSAMHASGAFDAVAISLVAAGESSGNMPLMLERLADLKRRQMKLRSQLIGALVYPCLLVTMGLGVMVTMLMFVLPRFELLFETLDSPLPATTQFMLWLSLLLREHWPIALAAFGLAAGGAVYLVRSGAGRAAFDRHYLGWPLVGPLGRSLISARVARMLGTLLESKVGLTESLELTRRSAANREYQALLERAEQAVSRGETLSSVLEASDLLTPGVQEAIRNGESTGRIGQPLLLMAEFLDEENDVAMKSLASTIEPLILIALGLVVGFIALSIFLPMFDMISVAQGGP